MVEYSQNVGMLKRISLNDELICSSRVIFATVQVANEKTIDIRMVREVHSELHEEFDQLWEKVRKNGEEELIGTEVKINQYQYNSYAMIILQNI